MSRETIYQPRHERRSTRLVIRDVDYCIHEWGAADAPLLVYLHGWGDTGSCFQPVADRLADDWRIVAPDWRGFGRSDAGQHAFWFPDYLADLDQLLSVYSPSAPVRLVGHSMGGNVAALYAGSMRERVAALCNVEGLGLHDTDPGQAPEHYRKWLQRSREREAFSEYADFTALADRLRRRNPNLEAGIAEFVAREWAEEAGGVVKLRAHPAHRLPNAVLYRRGEAEACWKAITAPNCLITGSDSEYATMAASAMEPYFGEPFVIEGAGHMIHLEAPDALAAAVDEFFRQSL